MALINKTVAFLKLLPKLVAQELSRVSRVPFGSHLRLLASPPILGAKNSPYPAGIICYYSERWWQEKKLLLAWCHFQGNPEGTLCLLRNWLNFYGKTSELSEIPREHSCYFQVFSEATPCCQLPPCFAPFPPSSLLATWVTNPSPNPSHMNSKKKAPSYFFWGRYAKVWKYSPFWKWWFLLSRRQPETWPLPLLLARSLLRMRVGS